MVCLRVAQSHLVPRSADFPSNVPPKNLTANVCIFSKFVPRCSPQFLILPYSFPLSNFSLSSILVYTPFHDVPFSSLLSTLFQPLPPSSTLLPSPFFLPQFSSVFLSLPLYSTLFLPFSHSSLRRLLEIHKSMKYNKMHSVPECIIYNN